MHRKTFALCSTAVAASFSLLLTPQRAQACSPPLCDSPVRTFKEGASVPGNLVHFAILRAEPGLLSLHTLDGAEIPASIQTIAGSRVFAPNDPIAAHTEVELRYTDTCRDPSAPTRDRTFRFSTYEAATSSAFQVDLVPYSKGLLLRGDETKPYAASRMFRIDLFGDDAPHVRHLLDYTASIGVDPLELIQIKHETFVRVDSTCSRTSKGPLVDSCGVLWDVENGPQTLTLTTNAVGTDLKPAAIEVSFEIGCENTCPDASVELPDPPVEPTDAATPPKGEQTDDDAVKADGAQGGSACSVSGGQSTSSLLAVLGIVALIAFRRSRKVFRA